MDISSLKGNPRIRVGIILLVFMAVALVLRLIPALFVKDSGFLYTYDTDGWYTLRQIEVMVHQFPQYNWFDPMTAFPTGKFIDWGPLYPFIAAVLCLITGATFQAAIVSAAGWVSPIMAALMVPVVYYVGKTIRDWQTGIVAAGLVAVVSYHYFFLSWYGLISHHIAEVFISTIFLLLYISAIVYVRKHGLDRGDPRTLYVPIMLAALAGVCYFCALLASPTVILMLVVIGIYTLVQCILDQWAGHSSGDLLMTNGIFLSLSAALLVLFGFHATGISITQYHPDWCTSTLRCSLKPGCFLHFRILWAQANPRTWSAFAILGVAGCAAVFLYPPFTGMGQQAFRPLFGSTQFSVGVVETLPLTLPVAWDFFGLSIILSAGGLLVLGYSVVKKHKAEWIFLLVWSLVLLILTIRYQRFDYYSTVNIVLLSAICITEPFRWQDAAVRAKVSALVSRIVPASSTGSGTEAIQEKTPAVPERSGKKKKTTHPEINGRPRERSKLFAWHWFFSLPWSLSVSPSIRISIWGLAPRPANSPRTGSNR